MLNNRLANMGDSAKRWRWQDVWPAHHVGEPRLQLPPLAPTDDVDMVVFDLAELVEHCQDIGGRGIVNAVLCHQGAVIVQQEDALAGPERTAAVSDGGPGRDAGLGDFAAGEADTGKGVK